MSDGQGDGEGNEPRITDMIARAHAVLAAVLEDGGVAALYPAIARALEIPCGPNAEGSFYPASRDRILPVGVRSDGGHIERSQQSALDIGSWATGEQSGYAPFGWVSAPWLTIAISHGGRRLGGAVVTNVTEHVDDTLKTIMLSIASHAGALIRLRALVDEAERMATTDLLTGVATRRKFLADLGRACQSRSDYLLFFVDLDNFKHVNDTKGHEAGDRMLREAASSLTRTIRPDEIVGRWGGDEFVVLVRAAADVARDIARRLEGALNEAGIGGSIGWAIAEGDAGAVIKAADSKMYGAKMARRQIRAVK